MNDGNTELLLRQEEYQRISRAAFCNKRAKRQWEALLEAHNKDSDRTLAHDAALDKILGTLPIATYRAGDAVLTAGSKTGRLLILKNGGVAILKGSIEIARVKEPGAIIGELSALLDQPHTADVRALEDSQFRVADATLLERDPIAVLHIARTLARRLVAIDNGFVELKKQLQASQSPGVLGKTLEKIEKTLAAWNEDVPPLTPGWRNLP